jgi:hypothetical protein
MTDFAIDPLFASWVVKAPSFAPLSRPRSSWHECMRQHMGDHAAEALGRLEDVRSAEEAQEAAQAFRTWIASGLLARADEATERRMFSKRASTPKVQNPALIRTALQ